MALDVFIGKGKWVPMDHSKSKKHEGVLCYNWPLQATLKGKLRNCRVCALHATTTNLVIRAH